MKKVAMKLMILLVLLVSMSGIVMGTANTTTNVTGAPTDTNTRNVTGIPTETNTAVATEIPTEVNTPEKVEIPNGTYSPSETNIPLPVDTPKSPGFESVISMIVLISTVYIIGRK